jgi:hypothetical protein
LANRTNRKSETRIMDMLPMRSSLPARFDELWDIGIFSTDGILFHSASDTCTCLA